MTSPKTFWWSALCAALMVGVGASGLGASGCSDESKLKSAELSGLPANPLAGVGTGPCPNGLRRECSVTLGEQGGVVNCMKGSQLCEAGDWGQCKGDTKFEIAKASAPLKTLSLSTPADCPTNPCNPACRYFNEEPPVPYQPAPDPTQLWKTGSFLDYPVNSTATVQPCATVSDCQAGQECDQVLQACVRHVSGEIISSCATFDLIVAPTCRDGVTDTIPVCNRGSIAAPVGVKIAVLAAGQIRNQSPNLVVPAGAITCLTTQQIPPGKCIDVTTCGAIANGREIMVNPKDGTEIATECDFGNNWSVFQNGACNQSICQAGKATGARVAGCAVPLRGTYNVGTDLLARWPLDELSGTVATDVSGWSHNLTVTAATSRVAGRLGTALVVSPTGPKFASQADVDLGDTAQVSVALWMKNNGANDYAGGFVSHLDAGTFEGWQIQRTAAGLIQVELAAVGTTTSYDATLAPNDNNWHHVAFTWDGDTGALVVYLDGIQSQTATHNAVATLGTDARPVAIGRTPAGAIFNGPVDDVSIYRGVLSPAQVFRMAQSSGANAGVPSYARVSFTPRLAGSVPTCGTDEVFWGNKCYWPSEDAAFDDVEGFCVARGGHLISINRPEEQAFAATLRDYSTKRVWNGLNDRLTEGQWVWTDGSCRDYVDWDLDSGQPDGGPAVGDEDCVFSNPISAIDTKWRDRPCSVSVASGPPESICERNPDNSGGVCALGQLAGPDGRCYKVETAPLSYSSASAACVAKGIGWSLAPVANQLAIDFVGGVLNCQQAWIGSVTGANYLPTEPNGAVGMNCTRTNALGKWMDDDCSVARPYICAGPTPETLPVDLTRVANAAACTADNQYYLDDPLNPTLMTLCPLMCPRLSGTLGDVTYEYGCQPTAAVAKVITQTYLPLKVPAPPSGEPEPDCPAGTQLQWSYLVYHTSTPADSSVQFEARTAASIPDLSSAAFAIVGTAQSSPTDTQTCWYADTCRVSLFDLLMSPANRFQTLELRVTLTPGALGQLPLLNDWEVTYSCQPSQ